MPRLRVLLVLLASAAPLRADDLRTLSGKTVTGTLAAITETDIILKTDAGQVATPLPQVLALDLKAEKPGPPPAEKFALVRLVDDSALRCTDLTLGATDVSLTLTSGATLKLPLAAVESIRQDAQDAGLQRQWERYGKQRARRDRVFILREGELNPVEGTLGDVDPKAQAITFTREGAPRPVSIPLAKLAGLAFYRADPPAESPVCRVSDQHGNTVAAAKLTADGTTLTVTTTYGATLPLKQETLAKLDFNFGRLTFLSDLDPKVTAPYWDAYKFTAVRKDANLDGGPLTLLDKQFPKGVSSYAGVELEYALGGKYKDFKATLGVDPRIAEEGQGKVTVTVYCDGEKRLTKEASATAATPLVVNVKDVNTLRIVVAGPNFTPFAGHAVLADARISQ